MIVRKRAARLTAALNAKPFDVVKANATMRENFSRVVVDHRNGQLALKWRHDGETMLTYDAGFKDEGPPGAHGGA